MSIDNHTQIDYNIIKIANELIEIERRINHEENKRKQGNKIKQRHIENREPVLLQNVEKLLSST